jgi:hypothetical protein
MCIQVRANVDQYVHKKMFFFLFFFLAEKNKNTSSIYEFCKIYPQFLSVGYFFPPTELFDRLRDWRHQGKLTHAVVCAATTERE